MMMMESPVGMMYELQSSSTSYVSSCDQRGQFLQWIVHQNHHM